MSGEEQKYSVKVDTNNIGLLSKLNYYIILNNIITDKQKKFIIDDRYMVAKKPMYFFYSLDILEIVYEEEIIYVEYVKNRSSRNFNMTEVRFDNIILWSNKSFEHINKFIYMIDAVVIPDSPDTELSKFIWKNEDEVWKYCQTFRRRSLDSIYFHKKEEIVDALEKFFKDEKTADLYKNLDIPYKKIFLFYGLPGAGKTSLIRALASHFDKNISLVKNVANMDDNSLEWMLTKLKKNNFLVFEDIDCLFNKREAANMKTNISFSGILNLLDGVSSYDKLVIFITTNHINNLDFAFKRRVDMFVEFSYAKHREIVDMYCKFFRHCCGDDIEQKAEVFFKSIKGKKITINTLEKFFINCLNKNVDPLTDIDYIDYYNAMVDERMNSMYS